MGGLHKVQDDLSRLGKHKTGGGCLYIKSLSDVNRTVLKSILAKAFKDKKQLRAHTS
jgi:hypothetical protein